MKGRKASVDGDVGRGEVGGGGGGGLEGAEGSSEVSSEVKDDGDDGDVEKEVIGGPPRNTETRARPKSEGRRVEREPSGLISSSSCCRATNSASMPTGVPGTGRSEAESVRKCAVSSSWLASRQ